MSNNSALVRKIIVNSYNEICSHEKELGLAMENAHKKFEKKKNLVIHCVWHDSDCIFE